MMVSHKTLAVLLGALLMLATGFAVSINTTVSTAYAQELPTNTPAPTLTPSMTPLPPIPPGALTATVIRAGVLFAREAPFVGASVVGRVQIGETYAVVGRNPDATWYLLELGGRQGWAFGYYLHIDGNEFNADVRSPYFSDAESAAADVVVRAIANLKLREEPNVTSAQIGRVTWGAALPVLARSEVGSWYQVIWKDTTGWVFSPYTSVIEGDIDTVPFASSAALGPAAEPEYDISVITPTPAP